jgi:hypothetical protein
MTKTLKTGTALVAALFAMTALNTGDAEARCRNSANGGNGGGFNVVIGNGNSVGNGGNGGNILSSNRGCRRGFFGRSSRNSANGGNGGNFNVVIGNGNSVGNGGNGGNILDLF